MNRYAQLHAEKQKFEEVTDCDFIALKIQMYLYLQALLHGLAGMLWWKDDINRTEKVNQYLVPQINI